MVLECYATPTDPNTLEMVNNWNETSRMNDDDDDDDSGKEKNNKKIYEKVEMRVKGESQNWKNMRGKRKWEERKNIQMSEVRANNDKLK